MADPADPNAPTAVAAAQVPARRRVAVVVVHGVADQQPGETSRSVVELLVSAELDDESGSKVVYEAQDAGEFVILVTPLPATVPLPDLEARPCPWSEARLRVGADVGGVTPRSAQRPTVKALLQSFRSDFQRTEAIPEPTWRFVVGHALRSFKSFAERFLGKELDLPPDTGEVDRGLQFTQYLLRKANRNAVRDEANESYASRRIGLTRRARAGSGNDVDVDVYEMYWADLSRLSGAIPRILTELFTLIFRLSRLGRETVDEASRYSKSNRLRRTKRWTILAACQSALDWLFVYVLAMLFVQLFMLGVFAMVIATAGAYPAVTRYVGLVALLVGIGTVAWRDGACALPHVARTEHGLARVLVFALTLAVLGVAMSGWPDEVGPWGAAILTLAILSFCYHAVLRVAADRFPFAHVAGMSLWASTVGAAMLYLIWRRTRFDEDAWTALIQALLAGFEWTLVATGAWWFVALPPFVVWLFATVAASRGGNDAERRSSATGRLGLLLSLTTFVLLGMALWASLQPAFAKTMTGRFYTPTLACLWIEQPLSQLGTCLRSRAASSSPASAPGRMDAASFLEDRYKGSIGRFSIVAMALLVPIAYLLAMVLPSVAAELGWLIFKRGAGDDTATDRAIDETRRLGRWLTRGFRGLDDFVLGCIVLISIAAALLASLVIVPGWPNGRLPWLADLTALMNTSSEKWLKSLVLTATGGLTALFVLGGFLSKFLPGLRGPIDVALDVDNYLREFPRQQIPRARIFARYRALLAEIKSQGYEHLVIVAHSQGTVITAELLRFLSSDSDRLTRSDERPERLKKLLGCRTHLLTLGCPLRQLYAARFPTLYRWILQDGRPVGPCARDIGVSTWANAYCSGDYVGRWLWSGTPEQDALPTTDTVHGGLGGRTNAYDRFDTSPPKLPDLTGHAEYETCIGFGAHTHYFDRGQTMVAALVDRLITAR